jgi:hypothetical protein
MHFDASRRLLAAAVLGVGWGIGCDDMVHVPPPDPKPPAGEVWGRAMDSEGIPSRYVPPIHIGDQSTAVTTDGTFRFSGVQAPYDLVVGDAGDSITDPNRYGHDTVVYEGVTRSDPALLYPSYTSPSYGGSAYVTGRVPYFRRGYTRIIVVSADGRAGSDNADGVSSSYMVEARWSHGETARVTLYALRYGQNDVLQDRFVKYLSLRDDERRVVDLEEVPFTPAPTAFLNGSFRVEPYTSSRGADIYVNFGRTVLGIGSIRRDTRFPDAFSTDVPLFPGATYQVQLYASWFFGDDYSNAYRRFVDLRPGAEPIQAIVYAGPELLEPARDAAGVDVTAPIRWRSSGGTGVYQLAIHGAQERWYWDVDLFTARTEVVLNDIPALHEFMRPGATYRWSVRQLPTAGTVDQLLAGREVTNEAGSRTEGRHFTTSAAAAAVP